jgi:hypothetical protein
MNSLLKLIHNEDQAKAAIKLLAKKKLMLVNKKYGMVLNDSMIDAGGVTVNHGGYGSSFSVNIGKTFGTSWGLAQYSNKQKIIYSDTGSAIQWDQNEADYNEERGKGLSGLAIFFSDKKWRTDSYDKWERDLSAASEQIIKLGGSVVGKLEDADVVVVFMKNVRIDVPENVVVVDQYRFFEILPNPADRATPTKKLTGDANSLWKLLSVRDLSSIKQGLELASAIPEQIDPLIEGCEFNKKGVFVRNKKFTVTGPAQAFLDVALFGLLSIAPEKSSGEKLRKSIKSLELSIVSIPNLVGFESLETLVIELTRDALSSSNLKGFGHMPKLKELKISSEGWSSNDALASLDGLDAPSLENVSVYGVGLRDVVALAGSTKLQFVDLSRNDNLKNIDSLASSVHSLKFIDLNGCDSIESLKPLSGLSGIENLVVEDSTLLHTLEGLEDILIKNAKVTYSVKIKDSIKLRDLLNISVPGATKNIEISKFSIEPD